jgi:diguanylate cyclase
VKYQRTNSLASHIMVIVLLASSIALGMFAMTLMILDHRSSIAQLDSRLSTLADIMGQNSTAALSFNDRDAANEVLQALRNEPPIVSACLYDLSNTLFAQYQRNNHGSSCSAMRVNSRPKVADERYVFHSVRHRGELVGTICIASDMQNLQRREGHLVMVALLLALIALALGGVSGAFLQLRISKPISALTLAMDRVTAGETLDAQVAIAGSNEIAHLATGFNAMLNELKRRDELTRRAEEQLLEQARTDALTGLPNRRLLKERLSQSLALAYRQSSMIALLYIDLDGFKLVNDSLGHSVGDLLLCEVSTRLRSRVRTADTLARVGGDEFTVILNDLKHKEEAAVVARSLLESLAALFNIEDHDITIGASIGISVLADGNVGGADLLRQADSAMYAAKRSGRNRIMYFSPELSLMARERLTLESQLRGAIGRKEIHLHYQPEFDLRTGRLVRFEALARWMHPNLGQVPPGQFIPVAEESGLIHPLGGYIMEEACREAMTWQHLSLTPIQVAVNVSAIQFNTESIVEDVAEVLQRTGLSPHLLQIELTESVMVGSMRLSIEKMKKLQGLGVSLAIDDFGTGYSSLSYLPELPVNAIKIDRSFLKNINPDSQTAAMIRSIVGMAHTMNMVAIVEGVEEETQLALILELGADEVQGFLVGRPTSHPIAFLMEHLHRADKNLDSSLNRTSSTLGSY